MDRYCLSCHREQQKARGLVPVAFETLSTDDVEGHAAEWEGVVRKMRAGLMPPAGMPRPDRANHEAFLGWLEGELDRVAAATPNPGRKEPFHRLNRTEYRNAIRDLLDLEIDVASMLPGDDASYGFDNIAGVLKLSPTLVERYLGAAQQISRIAVGTAPPFPAVDAFRVADDRSQEDRLPGSALGTRGGTRIRYTFPVDGFYTLPRRAVARPQRTGAALRRSAAARGEHRRRARPAVHAARHQAVRSGAGRRRGATFGGAASCTLSSQRRRRPPQHDSRLPAVPRVRRSAPGQPMMQAQTISLGQTTQRT